MNNTEKKMTPDEEALKKLNEEYNVILGKVQNLTDDVLVNGHIIRKNDRIFKKLKRKQEEIDVVLLRLAS